MGVMVDFDDLDLPDLASNVVQIKPPQPHIKKVKPIASERKRKGNQYSKPVPDGFVDIDFEGSSLNPQDVRFVMAKALGMPNKDALKAATGKSPTSRSDEQRRLQEMNGRNRFMLAAVRQRIEDTVTELIERQVDVVQLGNMGLGVIASIAAGGEQEDGQIPSLELRLKAAEDLVKVAGMFAPRVEKPDTEVNASAIKAQILKLLGKDSGDEPKG